MTTITLSVLERLQVSDLLPKSGKLIEMEVARGILEKVRLATDEIEAYEIHDTPDGKIVWNKEKAQEIQFYFADMEIQLLKKGIDDLDRKGEVSMDIAPLARRILNY
jgi:hypothetical protein